jgi:hypothetical protein
MIKIIDNEKKFNITILNEKVRKRINTTKE